MRLTCKGYAGDKPPRCITMSLRAERMRSAAISCVKLIKRNEKGFTLIEILIAVSIASVVVAAGSAAMIQIMQSTAASAQMSALRQVQTAGYWVSHDGIQSQNITTNSTPPHFLQLQWTDWEGGSHNVTYDLQDMSGGLKQLQRTHVLNTDPAEIIIVGQHLTTANNGTSCSWNETARVLNLSVEASVIGARGAQKESRTYEIKPRPDAVP